MDASSKSTSDESYAQLGDFFRKGRNPASGKYWLSTFPRPWLLVIDNADDPDLDLSSLLPPGNAGHILITTRNPHVSAYATVRKIRLTRMDPEEAIELLLRSAYPDDERSRAEPAYRPIASQIAERLGYLAIAIHQAGSTVRRRICTLEKYLTSYLGQRGLLLGSNISIDRQRADIITTWEIPFRVVETRQDTQYQDAVTALHLLAFFHYEAIPESLIEAAMISPDPCTIVDKYLPAMLTTEYIDLDAVQLRLRQALGILYEYSIIELDEDRRICSLHPVVHEWARSRISAAGRIDHWLRCTAYVLSCSGRDYASGPLNTINVSALLPHVDSFMAVAASCEYNLYSTREDNSRMEIIASIYERSGRWRDALRVLVEVLQYQTRMHGSWSEDTLQTRRKVSMCHWNLFEVEQAIRLQLQITAIRWARRPSLRAWTYLIKPAHAEYLISLSDLTQSLWLGGVRTGSRKAGERAVHGLSLCLGSGNLITLEATFNLARTYRHIGLLEQAHRMLVSVYRQRKILLGPEHPDTLMASNELGMSYNSRKTNLALAEKLVRQALTMRKHILGAEHAYTLWSVNDLAKVLSTRNRHEAAARLLEEAVPAVSRTLGDQHVGMHMTKGNLAKIYAAMERWEDALVLIKEVLAHIDSSHPEWLRVMIGCTRLQIRCRHLEDAELTCQLLVEWLNEPQQSIFKSIATNLWNRNWKATAGRLAAAYVAEKADRSLEMQTVTGLLYEAYRRGERELCAKQLRSEYPDLNEFALDQPFQLT